MSIFGLRFGWQPKEGVIYKSHNSIHEMIVGQKAYAKTRVTERTVKIIMSGKVFSGSFSVSKEVCTINIKSDQKHRFLTPIDNVKFDKEVKYSNGCDNYYGNKHGYPISSITYTVEVIDPKKMDDITKNLDGLSNLEIMKMLFKDNIIKSKEPDFIYENNPIVKSVDFSKIEGMLLGIAIGDSLGNTSESMMPKERKLKHGLITEYLPNRYAHNNSIGLPSDDTQLAFDTLEVILDNGKLNMEELAKVFSSHRIFGIGKTVKEFIKNYKDYKEPWYLSGVVNGAGNGALMRIAPIIISYIANPKENLWADTILATMLTHNSPLAIGSSVAFINMLCEFLSSRTPPDKDKMINEFTDILGYFTADTECNIRNPKIRSKFSNSAHLFIKQAIEYGYKNNISVKEFSEYFGSGAYVLETDAISLYIISKYLDDPKEAIIEAVNYSRDNDTTASIVGAAMGALYGRDAFKDSWISGLSGRIREYDDRKVFELINRTKEFLDNKKY